MKEILEILFVLHFDSYIPNKISLNFIEFDLIYFNQKIYIKNIFKTIILNI